MVEKHFDAVPTSVSRRLLSADDYQRMIRFGILRDGERVELINGELLTMAALGVPHVPCVARLNYWLTPKLIARAIVSVQSSFRLSSYSEPEPDITLFRFRDDFYSEQLPGAADVLLIIEVADSLLCYDHDTTVPLYAAAGISESWLVGLQQRCVTVYRDPRLDGYQSVSVQTRGTALSPLAFPDLEMDWEDIFGPAPAH